MGETVFAHATEPHFGNVRTVASERRIVGRTGEHRADRVRVCQGLVDGGRTEPRPEPQGNGCDVSALQRVGTAWRTTSRPSAVLREALIRFSHCLLAIGTLEAANGKVTSRHLLKMLDERVVHGSAAQRTDERDGLSGELSA